MNQPPYLASVIDRMRPRAHYELASPSTFVVAPGAFQTLDISAPEEVSPIGFSDLIVPRQAVYLVSLVVKIRGAAGITGALVKVSIDSSSREASFTGAFGAGEFVTLSFASLMPAAVGASILTQWTLFGAAGGIAQARATWLDLIWMQPLLATVEGTGPG